MTRIAADEKKRELPARTEVSVSATEPGLAGVTRWRQIADAIESTIHRGELGPGDRLPAETELAERHGVNRHTVRRAIAALAERGLVLAARGSGTYVGPGRLAYPISRRTRFSNIVGSAGREAGGRLLADAVCPADREVARRLRIAVGAEVTRLELLRSADGVPLCLATTWLPRELVPEAASLYRSTRSMTRALAKAGIADYQRRSTLISAAIADAVDGDLLRIAPGRPLIVVDSVDVTGDGRPVLTTRARFAADRIELSVEG